VDQVSIWLTGEVLTAGDGVEGLAESVWDWELFSLEDMLEVSEELEELELKELGLLSVEPLTSNLASEESERLLEVSTRRSLRQ